MLMGWYIMPEIVSQRFACNCLFFERKSKVRLCTINCMNFEVIQLIEETTFV